MSEKIAIIGGGAAGLMCACIASDGGCDVTLFEKNRSERIIDSERAFDNAYLGKKLLITGKGRCNLTNDCSLDDFLSSVPTNSKFLYAAYNAFPPRKVMEYFESIGVPLKVERGNRVFPVSDKSLDVLRALKKVLAKNGVKVINKKISDISSGDGFILKDEDGAEYRFDKCVVCTGGISYPQTGSDGDGYVFARKFGLSVTDTRPSLVPLVCEGTSFADVAGLTLKNVSLSIVDTEKKKTVFSKQGELLFTHTGISGPLVLAASSHMKDFSCGKYRADIDLKPALDEQTIDARLVSLFSLHSNKKLENVLCEMLPKSMAAPFAKYCGSDPETLTSFVTKQQRRTMCASFKKFSLKVLSLGSFSEAVVTSGGVSVKEIDPSTMQSKKVSGLYFAGEVLDVDAYTGGFNLQIAFSTAYLAAKSLIGR